MRGWALFWGGGLTVWSLVRLSYTCLVSKSGNHTRQTFRCYVSWSQNLCWYHSVVMHLTWKNWNRFQVTETERWGVFTSGAWTQIWAHLDISLVSVNTVRTKINRRQVRRFHPGSRRLDNVVGGSLYLYLRMRFERDSAEKKKRACRPIKTSSCLFSPESVASQKQEPLWFSELSR